jgi:hypothetical protein
MSHHAALIALLAVILTPTFIGINWYLLGLGVGIAHRGYRRTAPRDYPTLADYKPVEASDRARPSQRDRWVNAWEG